MIGGIYTLAWDYLANEMADNTHIIGFLLQNLKYSEVHIKCREQKRQYLRIQVLVQIVISVDLHIV